MNFFKSGIVSCLYTQYLVACLAYTWCSIISAWVSEWHIETRSVQSNIHTLRQSKGAQFWVQSTFLVGHPHPLFSSSWKQPIIFPLEATLPLFSAMRTGWKRHCPSCRAGSQAHGAEQYILPPWTHGAGLRIGIWLDSKMPVGAA